MAQGSWLEWMIRSLSWHKLIPSGNLDRLVVFTPPIIFFTGHPGLALAAALGAAKAFCWRNLVSAALCLLLLNSDQRFTFQHNPDLYKGLCMVPTVTWIEAAIIHPHPCHVLVVALLLTLYLALASHSALSRKRETIDEIWERIFTSRSAAQRIQGRLVHLASPDCPDAYADADTTYSHLCDVCDKAMHMAMIRRALDDQGKPIGNHRSFTFTHHTSPERLTRSALENGCALCRLFVAHAESSSDTRAALYSHASLWAGALERKEFRLSFWTETAGSNISALGTKISDIGFQLGSSANIWFLTALEPAVQDAPFVHCQTLDSAPTHLATQRIRECIAADISICGDKANYELPTRLIDVGHSDGDEMRLVVTQDLQRDLAPSENSYVALSHRWGSSKPQSQLTKERLRCQYQSSLPFTSLELTFQDAVTVTRRLGYRFLWIDSLCIVQDDPGDWRRECSRMAAVYANAVVTIAGASAADHEAGFLKWHNESVICCDLRLDWLKVRIRRAPDGLRATKDPEPPSVLTNRAWILQERLLSPRTLHFGKFRMELECKHDTQHSPQSTRPYHRRFDSEYILDPGKAQRWLVESPGGARATGTQDLDLPSEFGKILALYTQCKISKIDDILPAMSGIARKYHEWTGDEYFAGLWRRTLVEGLCWKRQDDSWFHWPPWSDDQVRMAEVDYDCPTYKVPSWSWASLNGPAGFVRDFPRSVPVVRPLADVVDIQVSLVSGDPFGQVDGGEVTLRVRTRQHQLSLFQSITCWSPLSMAAIVVAYLVPWTSPFLHWLQPWNDYVPDRVADSVWGRDVTVCLMCETETTSSKSAEKYNHWHAIVLESVGGAEDNAYRRIGYCSGPQDGADWWRDCEYATVKIM